MSASPSPHESDWFDRLDRVRRRSLESCVRGFGALRLRPGCGGQSMVEFALVLPVIVVLIFGCLQVGLSFFNYEQVASAANAGARAAAVSRGGDPTGAAQAAAKKFATTLGLADSQIAVTYASTASPAGAAWSYPGSVTVTVSYPMKFSLLDQVEQTFNLRATATKRIER